MRTDETRQVAGQAQTDGQATPTLPATPSSSPPALTAGLIATIQNWLLAGGMAGVLLLAFLGGLILNLMPCVLPVISIKVLSFVQQARESRLRVLTLGLSFAGGILLSFVILGLLILGLLKGIGLELQWGGFFQEPIIVIGFAAMITALALSLFGVFTLSPPRFVLEMGGRVQQEGHVNAFAMGLLATILGTACTAPFVSPAVAFAVGQPPLVGMLIFIALGLGMALPYVVLAAKPAWLRFVPRPGPWMKTFEHVMGFVLLATVVWLMSIVVAQLGGNGLLWTLVFLLFVAAAAWCYGLADFGSSTARQAVCYGGTVLLIALGWWFSFQYQTTIPRLVEQQEALVKGTALAEAPSDWNGGEIPWVSYTRQQAIELVGAGKTIFIDYTADWCVNCKANEKLVINTPEVREAMQRLGVVPMRADYTRRNAEIKADLERFKRAGVPMYVIIPANRPEEPILLNEILTKSAIIEGLSKAGPSVDSGLSVAASGM